MLLSRAASSAFHAASRSGVPIGPRVTALRLDRRESKGDHPTSTCPERTSAPKSTPPAIPPARNGLDVQVANQHGQVADFIWPLRAEAPFRPLAKVDVEGSNPFSRSPKAQLSLGFLLFQGMLLHGRRGVGQVSSAVGRLHPTSRRPGTDPRRHSVGQAALVVTVKSSNQAVSVGIDVQTPLSLPTSLRSTVNVWPLQVGSKQICA